MNLKSNPRAFPARNRTSGNFDLPIFRNMNGYPIGGALGDQNNHELELLKCGKAIVICAQTATKRVILEGAER